MTAIDDLIKKADELNKDCLKNLGPTVKEIVDAWDMIQTLMDIALDLRDWMSGMIVTHIEFELPYEEGKDEIPVKGDMGPYPLQIHDHLINIGPINIYSMVEALSDNIHEFITQTTGIASIFTPYAFVNDLQSYSIKSAGMLSFPHTKEPEKPESIIDETQSIDTGSLYSRLKGSALIVKEMETIRDRMAVLPIENGSAFFSALTSNVPTIGPSFGIPAIGPTSGVSTSGSSFGISAIGPSVGVPVGVHTRADIHKKVTDTYGQPGYEMEYVAGSKIVKDIDEFSGYVHDFFRIVEDISTIIKTRISEARDVTDISFLQKISMGALTAIDTDRTSTPVRTSIPKIHSTAGITSIEDTSAGGLHTADISKSKSQHKTTPVRQMIEVPDFIPVEKLPTGIEESAINAAALTGAISREFIDEKETLPHSREVMTPAFADVTKVIPPIPASTVPVLSAFNVISDYFTIASELGKGMTDMVEYGGEEVSNIFTHSSPIHRMVEGEDTGAALSLKWNILGGNGSATSKEPGIIHSMTMTGSLIKEGASFINDVFLSLPSDRTGYGGPAAATVPNAMENVMQMFYGSGNGTTPLSPTKGSTNHFHNTFNIVVNMKGAGDEHELRELGRKIGTILSDEIKRYGGLV